MRAIRSSALLVVLGLMLPGCLEEQRFITPEGNGVWAWAIDQDTPALLSDEDAGTIYLVEQRIEIPFREPTDEELAATTQIGDVMIPYGTLPWIVRGDIEVQVDFTISSLQENNPDIPDAAEATRIYVRVNPINEFHEYNPGFRVVDDELVVDFAGWEEGWDIAPGERISVTVREDELDETAVDLATVVNGAPNSNQIMYPGNQSAIDVRSQPFIPDVIPALTGVRIGLRAQGQMDEPPPNVMIEATVRVRDPRGVLIQDEMMPWMRPAPALFTPVSPMEE